MRAIRDVKCAECGTIYVNEYCDETFRCTCGGATTTYYGMQAIVSGGVERKADAFAPIVFGGERYEARDAWNKCRSEWKAIHGEDLEVTGDSKAARKAALEESHHRSIAEARRRGLHHIADNIERAGARFR